MSTQRQKAGMMVTRYWGGADKSTCYSISHGLTSENEVITLNLKEAKALRKLLARLTARQKECRYTGETSHSHCSRAFKEQD